MIHLDWCDHATAKHAVRRWHYSGALPVGKLVRFGVWEDKKFIGAVVFGDGVSAHKGNMFGVANLECTELVRVALSQHLAATSQIIAVAVRLIKKHFPILRVIISYADMNERHIGTLYQAAGWTYVKEVQSVPKILFNGRLVSNRALTGTSFFMPASPKVIKAKQELKDGTLIRVPRQPKHKYAFPLDREMRKLLMLMSKPYPKRAPVSGAVATSDGKAVQSRPARSNHRNKK